MTKPKEVLKLIEENNKYFMSNIHEDWLINIGEQEDVEVLILHLMDSINCEQIIEGDDGNIYMQFPKLAPILKFRTKDKETS